MKSSLPEELKTLITDAVQAAGASVYDIQFHRSTLQVMIEADTGVTIELCQRVSELLSLRLDQADLIPYAYRLEVSSPGLERRLRDLEDFRHFQGRRVRIVTAQGVAEGRIEAVTGETIELRSVPGTGQQLIPLSAVKRAHLVVTDDELFHRQQSPAGDSGPASAGDRNGEHQSDRSAE